MEFMTSLQGDLDEQKPSLFELLSEQQLASLIPPSLRYLLAVATYRYPRYLLRLLNSFDEVYALLSLAVERHYLRTYGGGFTENFYGLKRERVLRTRDGHVPRAALGAPEQVRESLLLSDRDVWKNLAVMVGIPYIKRKLDESYDIHAAHAGLLGPQFREQDEASLRKRVFLFYKWFLRHIYPSINAAYHFSLLAFSLAYLFDSTKYPSPWLWLIGTRIRRMSAADHKAIAQATAPRPSSGARPGQTSSLFSPRLFTHTLYPRLLSSLKILLPTSIFALKFLEWWHASDFARQLARKAAENLDLPAPSVAGLPAPSQRKAEAKSGVTFDSDEDKTFSTPPIAASSLLPIFTVPLPAESGLCPICSGPVVTPTASQVGYVYCYTCIHGWVEGRHARQDEFMAEHEGRWDSGAGRDAVTGRRLLGGSGGLRRIMV